MSHGFDEAAANFCLAEDVSYDHRVNNEAGWNWCLVPDGGYDAVFFAAMAIIVMSAASPRWDAIISLVAGGVYQILAHQFNLGHVSNASALWLGMRPADIFVFVFLPPFLLDVAVRIDFFMLKKMIVNVLMMAFVMVITSCLLLIPFMLYALDLKSNGWNGGYVALFGSAIASTDAAAVVSALSAGGAPEILSVLLEGESLFNDASSLTLFEIFKELVLLNESKPLGEEIGDIVAKTVETALVGVAIGLAMGIFTKFLFMWLQHRNMPDYIEVAFTVGGAYMTYYITQVWCKGSGCVGVVAYGLFGSATLLWGMSNKTRQSRIFQHFWSVIIFVVNALIFFYVGASCVNFTIRSSDQLYHQGGARALLRVTLYKLPIIWVYMLAVRAVFLLITFRVMRWLRVGAALSMKECLFLAAGGIRGSLSLVLAQTIATLATKDETGDRVKAEAAMYTAGFVILTLIIQAPLSAPLMTFLKLNKINKEQLLMRGHVKDMFFRFSATTLEEMQADAEDDEMLQGVDWKAVETATDFKSVLDHELPECQPNVTWADWLCMPWLISMGKWCGTKYKKRPLKSFISDMDDTDIEQDRAKSQKAQMKDDLSRMTAWKFKHAATGVSSVPSLGVPSTAPPQPSGSDILVITDSGHMLGQARSLPTPRPALPRPAMTKTRSMMRTRSARLTDTSMHKYQVYNNTARKGGQGADGFLSPETKQDLETDQQQQQLQLQPPASPFSNQAGLPNGVLPTIPAGNPASRAASGQLEQEGHAHQPNGAADFVLEGEQLKESSGEAMLPNEAAQLPDTSGSTNATTHQVIITLGPEEAKITESDSSNPDLSSSPQRSAQYYGPPLGSRTYSQSRLGVVSVVENPSYSPRRPDPLHLPGLETAGETDQGFGGTDTEIGGSSPVGGSPTSSGRRHASLSHQDSFAAAAKQRLLVIKASPPPGAAGGNGGGDEDQQVPGSARAIRHAKTMSAGFGADSLAGVAAATAAGERVVQRVGKDGSLATTSVKVRSSAFRGNGNGKLSRGSVGAWTNTQGAGAAGDSGAQPRSLATTSRGLSRSSQRGLGRTSQRFLGEVSSAAGEGPMMGDDVFQPPGDVEMAGGLGRRSVKLPVTSRALAKASIGARFFNQETERALTRNSTGLARPSAPVEMTRGARTMNGENEEPLVVRDTRNAGRSSKEGAFSRLSRLSNLPSKAFMEASYRSGRLGADAVQKQMMSEYRLRLLAGLKQYFRCRYIEGILSPQSYKTLSYITNKAHHRPDYPLPLWQLTKQEVSSGALLQWEAHCYYQCKRLLNRCKGSTNWFQRYVLSRLIVLPVMAMSAHLSHVQLSGLEAAVELWISLTASLQTQWLEYSGAYGAMVLDEVNINADGAWKYIVDRRIEAPERFQAIQTYRATVQLLSHQLAFVEEMSHGGMIDEKEAHRMEDSMQRRLQKIVRSGPQWRRQSVKQILSSVPFLRNIHPRVVHWLRSHSEIKMYGQGECIWEYWGNEPHPPGMFIVLSGVVRNMIQVPDGSLQPVFLGAGGVGGLIVLVLGQAVSGVGMRAAYAEGNALGKGPVVMHIPWGMFTAIQHFSRIERLPTWQQLELNIFRTAAAFVLDLLRHNLMHQLGEYVSSSLANIVMSERFDTKGAKKQRIRALLKDIVERNPEMNENGAPAVHIDWASELLALPPAAALALLDGSLDATVATAAWHEAMFQAIAGAAHGVYDMIKANVRESWLVVLTAGQSVWQTSTMVLIQGSLATSSTERATSIPAGMEVADKDRLATELESAAVDALHPLQSPGFLGTVTEGQSYHVGDYNFGAFSPTIAPHRSQLMRRQMSMNLRSKTTPRARVSENGQLPHNIVASPNPEHIAPSMLIWTSDYFPTDSEVPAQEPVRVTAGPDGATLLVWGVEMKSLLKHPDGDDD